MNNKTIFVVTVFEKCEPDDRWGADIGCSRSPCFRYTFEEAEEVVKTNMCDIWEAVYDYARIDEIGCEIYPYPHMTKFYKFNKDGYEPIEKPECLQHIGFCGIG